MDERCKACHNICKRIDPEELPVRYEFPSLTPNQALKLVEVAMRTYYNARHIEPTRSAGSIGHQIAILCETHRDGTKGSGDDQILLIAQAEKTLKGSTEVWFRYGVPEPCCNRPETVDEFSDMVRDALAVLLDNDARFKAL